MNQQSLVPMKKPANQGVGSVHLQRKCGCESTGESCSRCASNTGKWSDPLSKKSGLQRKLTIGESNDPLELEADRVADQVMAESKPSILSGTPPLIQRYMGQVAEGVGSAPESVDHVIASSGRPLELALRRDMEQRFGHDFSQVRVHSNADAEKSARDVHANAYTVGQNIVFGTGQFAPSSNEGRRLIAHELTHVVQQHQFFGAPGTTASAELDASRAATHSVSGIPVTVQAVAPPNSLQREDDDKWMDAWKKQHPAQPKMGSKEWTAALNAGSPEEEKARQEALARLKSQANPALAHTAPSPPPDPMKMKSDPKELADLAKTLYEANRKAEAERQRYISDNKAAEEEKKRREAQVQEERTSLGAAGPNDKRRALAGSPVLAIQQHLETSFQSKAEIEDFRKHVATITPEQFFEAYPGMSLDVYLTLHDFGQVGKRNWKNFVQPPTHVDAIMRRALKLKPDAYLSQSHQDELANAIANGRRKDVAKELGISPEELDRISSHFKGTNRSGLFVEKDPLIMAQGYTGRESGYGAFQMQQRLANLEVLSSSPLAGVGYGGASLFTDDEQKRMAVAGLGANWEGLATGLAGVGAGRQATKEAGRSVASENQITNTAPAGGRGSSAKSSTAPVSAAEREANVLFGELSFPSSGGNSAGRGENAINIAPSGQGQFPPPTPITAAKGSRGLPEGLKSKESGTLPLGNLADRRTAAAKPPSEPAAQPVPKAVEQQEPLVVGQTHGSGQQRGQTSLSVVTNEPVVDAAKKQTKPVNASPSTSTTASGTTGKSDGGSKSTPAGSSGAAGAKPAKRGPTIASFGQEEVDLLVEYWTNKSKATTDSELKERYQKRINMLNTRGRANPKDWDLSEEEMVHIHTTVGGKGETAYRDRSEVPNVPGEKGVTKPDLTTPNTLGEVKTWNLKYPSNPETAEKMLKNVAWQVEQRRIHGPRNVQQTIILDTRGQKLSAAQKQAIGETFSERTGLPIEQIQIVEWQSKIVVTVP